MENRTDIVCCLDDDETVSSIMSGLKTRSFGLTPGSLLATDHSKGTVLV